jgi:hypothetical protein
MISSTNNLGTFFPTTDIRAYYNRNREESSFAGFIWQKYLYKLRQGMGGDKLRQGAGR